MERLYKQLELQRKRQRSLKRKRKFIITLTIMFLFCIFFLVVRSVYPSDEPLCGMTEHVHTKECYTQMVTEIHEELICNLSEENGHSHNANCYKKTPVFGDFELTCSKTEHIHTDECYPNIFFHLTE